MKANPQAEELLIKAESFSPEYQKSIFKKAACGLVEKGEYVQAKNLLTEKSDDNSSVEYWLSMIFYSNAFKAFGEQRFDDAIDLTNQISFLAIRTEAQAFLAKQIYQKNPKENKQKALSILADAKMKIDSITEIYNKSVAMDEILSVYALIDEEATFPMFELLIDQTNKIEGKDKSIKDFRFRTTISSDGTSVVRFDFSKTVWRLKNRNLAKTLDIINKLQRPGKRINVKLNLLESESNYRSAYHIGDSQYCDF